jgi:hypothetical protein
MLFKYEWSPCKTCQAYYDVTCGMQTHCQATKTKRATIQQPLLSNSSANKHVSMVTWEHNNNGRDDFYVVHAKML